MKARMREESPPEMSTNEMFMKLMEKLDRRSNIIEDKLSKQEDKMSNIENTLSHQISNLAGEAKAQKTHDDERYKALEERDKLLEQTEKKREVTVKDIGPENNNDLIDNPINHENSAVPIHNRQNKILGASSLQKFTQDECFSGASSFQSSINKPLDKVRNSLSGASRFPNEGTPSQSSSGTAGNIASTFQNTNSLQNVEWPAIQPRNKNQTNTYPKPSVPQHLHPSSQVKAPQWPSYTGPSYQRPERDLKKIISKPKLTTNCQRKLPMLPLKKKQL